MHDYDTVLKHLLKKSNGRLMGQLTQAPIGRWLDVELPVVQQRRVDLLGETAAGGLEHIELQSRNDSGMPFRMLEYRIGIYRQCGKFPRQTVLYVGRDKLTMESGLEAEQLSAKYSLVDVSGLDGERLLASDDLADTVLSLLTLFRNPRLAIRVIVQRIARLPPMEWQDRLRQLLLLSGLRELAPLVREEVENMPVTENIFDHELIKPAYQSGIQEGRLQGEQTLLRKMLESRFGPLPPTMEARLARSSRSEIEELGVRLLAATSLQELLPPD